MKFRYSVLSSTIVVILLSSLLTWAEISHSEKSREEKYFEAARKLANWLVENQVQNWDDANNGRFLGTYNVEKPDEVLFYSINWTTATSLKGLLMMYHRTGDEKYYDAAYRAGEYLKSLQILGERNPAYFGNFRENTPQTTWCYPRDTLTAAWGLLWMYEETGEKEYLERVQFFNDWFLNYAMADGWPLWEVNFRGEEPYKNIYLEGSFHGGVAAYFYDYGRVTGDFSGADKGIQFIADHFIDRFMKEDGSIYIIYDTEKEKYLDGKDKPYHPLYWQIMHRYNDDFSSLGLLGAYLYYEEDTYLEQAKNFARWLMDEQNKDGSFAEPFVHSASATVPILLLDLYKLTGNEEYRESAHRAGAHLIWLQETETTNPKAHGGIYGDAGYDGSVKEVLNIRASSYALIAFLKLEGKEYGPYYSVFDRSGELPELPSPPPKWRFWR